MGIRPLALGRLGDAYVLSSETCAFDLIEATYVRDVAPGEVLVIDRHGLRSLPVPEGTARHCVFEHVYFARPDSKVFGRSVLEARTEMGRRLARESGPADVVVPVPDSGIGAALGYAEEAASLRMGLVRNHYIGRTFIEPKQVGPQLRRPDQAQSGARGARGQAGHPRRRLDRARHHIAEDRRPRPLRRRRRGPPAHLVAADHAPCHYGIDTPRRSELIASSHTLEEIRTYLEADSSLAYLGSAACCRR